MYRGDLAAMRGGSADYHVSPSPFTRSRRGARASTGRPSSSVVGFFCQSDLRGLLRDGLAQIAQREQDQAEGGGGEADIVTAPMDRREQVECLGDMGDDGEREAARAEQLEQRACRFAPREQHE